MRLTGIHNARHSFPRHALTNELPHAVRRLDADGSPIPQPTEQLAVPYSDLAEVRLTHAGRGQK